MTFYEAAVEVLRTAKRPLTAQEITDRALEKGLIRTKGKTPAATMAAELYTRLRDNPEIVKFEDPSSSNRAKRGSVRWTLHRA